MSVAPVAEFKITEPDEMLVKDCAPLTIHPGEFIRDVLLPERKLKVTDVARRIHVNRVGLSNVLHGKHDVSRELAYRLGALLGDHVADLLIAYQHRWDLQRERDRREQLRHEIAPLA